MLSVECWTFVFLVICPLSSVLRRLSWLLNRPLSLAREVLASYFTGPWPVKWPRLFHWAAFDFELAAGE